MPHFRRSVLYMPASNARALEKARTLAADAFIFDLEDAVAPDAKIAARAQAVAAVQAGGFGDKDILIRVNGLGTPWFADDIRAAATSGAYGVLVPKIDHPQNLADVDDALTAGNAPAGFRVWSMIESPAAILSITAIAAHGQRLEVLVAGFADLAKDLGTRDRAGRAPLLYALSAIVMAARAHGLTALDGVYPPFTDPDGCRAEAEQARDYGYDGKTLIHPSQIAIANAAFSPSAADIAQAREIVAAYELAVAAGQGVAVLNGKMVEVLHAAQARALLALAATLTPGFD
jgi:citrate lyase subunit beta / citryl-CoA lyase